MAHHVPTDGPTARRRLIGFREIFLVLLALALLAIVPSVAQIMPKMRPPVPPAVFKWDAEFPAQNFPGSAFFYLDSTDVAANAELTIQRNVSGAVPFVLQSGSIEYARALKCMTDAIYYEAANEPDAGQRAIAQVVLNRMRHPAYPNSICGVIYQGSELETGCQFSYSCDGSMTRVPARASWLRAQRVAADALAGYTYAPVGLATHSHATYVYPNWAPSLNFIGVIGAHRFYSWKGNAGQSSAFATAYAGREPYPGPKLRLSTPASYIELDPALLQKRYDAKFAAPQLKSQPFIAPIAVYADDASSNPYQNAALPGSTDVKPQYQNSGTWKILPSG